MRQSSPGLSYCLRREIKPLIKNSEQIFSMRNYKTLKFLYDTEIFFSKTVYRVFYYFIYFMKENS